MHSLRSFLLASVLCLWYSSMGAQQQNNNYLEYIQTYAGMAQEQMARHGIPASITLAQGLLESAAGKSMLATRANNHFGIKVTTDWTGPYVLRDDDHPNEKFRQYNSVSESYEDHSLFLKRKRYESLFSLSPTDYQGWARGLKACGYATNPVYAENLINLIQLYELYQYDSPKSGTLAKGGTHTKNPTISNNAIRYCNGAYYIIAQPGDTWKSIALSYGIRTRKLRHYNEVPRGSFPQAGSPVYITSKHSRAARSLKGHYHTVQLGESIYTIAQNYGMKVRTLSKINHLPLGYAPTPGQKLRIR